MYGMVVIHGHISLAGENVKGVQIDKTEFNELVNLMTKRPLAPEGYTYMLRADTLEWELVELPPVPEPDPESETYPAWDIRSSTSFAVGDRVTSDGTVYECIKAHNASWTRQPPNAEYWRIV